MPQDASLLPAVERDAAQLFRKLPHLAFLADAGVLDVEFHSCQIADGMTLVSVDEDDRPTGFVTAERHGAFLHILELSVSRDAQGKGCGRSLLGALFDSGRRAGMKWVTLTTFRSVPWNGPFYERFGFRQLSEDEMPDFIVDILAAEQIEGLTQSPRCAMCAPIGMENISAEPQ